MTVFDCRVTPEAAMMSSTIPAHVYNAVGQPNAMRFIIISVLTLTVGIIAASGISWLVGLVWPAASMPVFVILAAWWSWLGWRYASARDRGRF
jgi:hypothetical protein